jgi:hypothetical protein
MISTEVSSLATLNISEGSGYLRSSLPSVRGLPLRGVIFKRSGSPPGGLTRDMQGSSLHEASRGYPHTSLFLQREIPQPLTGGRHVSTGGQKITRSNGCGAVEQFRMNIFYDTKQPMEELLLKSKKLKRGEVVTSSRFFLTIFSSLTFTIFSTYPTLARHVAHLL